MQDLEENASDGMPEIETKDREDDKEKESQ